MTTEEKIAELETNYKAMSAELEKLKAELAETQETIWTPKIGEEYLYLATDGSVSTETNDETAYDTGILNMNSVFRVMKDTDKHLEWYRDNILRVQNKLMQLHELLCPDCFPDWDTGKTTWAIYYDNTYKCFSYILQCSCNWFAVCFTREAAEKACEILNKEILMMKG